MSTFNLGNVGLSDGDVSESTNEGTRKKYTGWQKRAVCIAKVFIGIVVILIIGTVVFVVIEVLRSRRLAFRYLRDPFEQAREMPIFFSSSTKAQKAADSMSMVVENSPRFIRNR